ncbi:MAG TPA: BatD family protein [Chthoniobacterales bacterium]|nr:BatD family protein [Chthoniobacterales bacterium]
MKHFVTLFAAFFWSGLLNAAEPSVSASLSESSTDVDHPVQLEINVANARVTRPPNIAVEGLSINFEGTSSQTQILNFQASSVTTFTYVVTPTKAGTFQIPPVEVIAGGKVCKTSALTLTVVEENGNDADGSSSSDKPFFAELIVPKETAYVGEEIPIEVRFYFSQGIQYQPYPQGQYPMIDGEGFVTKKYPEPTEKQIISNGRTYNVVVYRTGLTGVKAGKLDLNSATQSFLIAASLGSRSAPGLIDPNQSFQQQIADIKTNGASILIKPIPTAGRPANFSGAVGDFTLSSTAEPLKAHTGDPVTMSVEIRGLGSFDRMERPVLSDTDGWRVYEPSEQVKSLDEIGLSGVKRYDYTLVAAKPVKALPEVEFSYFNPATEKFVTLKSPPTSIEIVGDQLPAIATAPANRPTSQQAKPTQTPEVLDIRLSPPSRATFVPLIRQRQFWIAQAIPATALLLLGTLTAIKKNMVTTQPQRMVNREKRLLWKKVAASKNRPEVLQAAVRLLELNSSGKQRAGTISSYSTLDEKIQNGSLPDDLRHDVSDLLAVSEATIYGHVGSDSLSEDERSKIKTILTRWKAIA